MEIYLVRHGKTEGTMKKLYYGNTDIPLCEEGIEELKKIRSSKCYPTADCYYTSGMKRANETLRLLYGDVCFMQEEQLKEFNFGEFEMKEFDEIKDHPDYIAWATDSTGNALCPSGESNNIFKERVVNGFNKICSQAKAEGKERVVIICHGGTILTLMNELFQGERNMLEWIVDCGKGYIINHDCVGNKTWKGL